MRKAQIYFNLLRVLCDHFLSKFKQSLSLEAMKQSTEHVEPTFVRLLGAVKVMYGCDFLLEDDLVHEQLCMGESEAQR